MPAWVLRGPDPEQDGVSAWRLVAICAHAERAYGVRSSGWGLSRACCSASASRGRRPGRGIRRAARPNRLRSKNRAVMHMTYYIGSPASAGKDAGETAAVEVTPEMIEAGVRILESRFPDGLMQGLADDLAGSMSVGMLSVSPYGRQSSD